METFVRLEISSDEIKNAKKEEKLSGRVITTDALIELLNEILDCATSDEAVEVQVFRNYILVGVRKKGYGDRFMYKFTNYGYAIGDSKSSSLGYAIQSIDETRSLPDYFYDAISGDKAAIREINKRLVRALEAKITRMVKRRKHPNLIKPYKDQFDAARRRLECSDEELFIKTEPIIIEVPKNPGDFYSYGSVLI